MRQNLFIIFILALISCNENNLGENEKSVRKTEQSAQSNPIEKQSALTWAENFRIFRDAVYHRDIKKVRTFIDFPIMNVNNEIWHLVYEGDNKALSLLSDKVKPFTEKDFDKYFDRLFPKTFISSILKLKTEELYIKGESQTMVFKEGDTYYQIFATYNNSENTLNLNLASNTAVAAIDGEGQEILDPGEYSVIYIFNILPKGEIKFNHIRLAG